MGALVVVGRIVFVALLVGPYVGSRRTGGAYEPEPLSERDAAAARLGTAPTASSNGGVPS